MSVYHNPRFPPAPPALGVRDLNAEQIAFRSCTGIYTFRHTA